MTIRLTAPGQICTIATTGQTVATDDIRLVALIGDDGLSSTSTTAISNGLSNNNLNSLAMMFKLTGPRGRKARFLDYAKS